MISYAQNFEDVILARLFAGRTDGFYVDVGAADPINLSVTKWFYDQGWSGINIEPNKKLFKRLTDERPRDINLDCGAGASLKEAAIFEPEIGELSTFDVRNQRKAKQSRTPGSMRSVSVFPLNDILNRHSSKRRIDFLKIDVEGWEHEVLKGLDLNLYRPIVMVIEATIPQNKKPSHQHWEPLVLRSNYSFVYFDGVNRFYLANEHLALKAHFSSPPNVFDNFEPFALVRAQTDAEVRLAATHRLEALLDVSERDRAARLAQIEQLGALLAEANTDRAERLAQIEQLDALLSEANTDRAARLAQIERLGALLSEANNDKARHLHQIEQLGATVEKMQLEFNRELAARTARIAELETQLGKVTAELGGILQSRFWKITHPKWLQRKV